MRFLGYSMIIGAMKSGTTTLHYILAQHPAIVAGIRKELNFFKRRKRRSVADYEALFPQLDKMQHAYTLDSSPNYAKSGTWDIAPQRIASLPGQKRLVYLLRDPIERIDSHIAHNVAVGRWTAEDFPLDHLLRTSHYATQLRKFEEAGLLGDVLLLDFADLTADPVGISYRVHDFLGIERVEPQSLRLRNPRKLNAKFIRPDQLPHLKEQLQHDVETLVTRYGFEQAKTWTII
jgi:hypothetical protein